MMWGQGDSSEIFHFVVSGFRVRQLRMGLVISRCFGQMLDHDSWRTPPPATHLRNTIGSTQNMETLTTLFRPLRMFVHSFL